MEASQRKVGVLLSYVSLIVNAIVGFAYIPILIGFMGQSEYGLYQLMGSIIAYLSVMDFGLSSTIIRYYTQYKALKDKQNMENVLALSTIIYTIITVLLLLVGGIIYLNIDGIFSGSLTSYELISGEKIFIILLVNLAISIPSKIFDAVITSHERFIFLKSVSILQIIAQPFVVIAVMRQWPTALAMVLIQTVFNGLLIITKMHYSFAKLKIKIKLHNFDSFLFRGMLKFSFYIFIGAVMDQVFWRTNQVILGIVASTAVVAIYSIASSISNNYTSLSTAITSVFLPRVTNLVAQNSSPKVLSDLFIRIGRLQFLLLSCVLSGFVLFGKQFIELLTSGENFSQAYIITLLLIIPFTFDLIQNIGITILQAKKMLAFRSIVFFAMSVINAGVSIPMAIYFGAVGCALSTGASFFIANAIVMNIYYYKKIQIDIWSFWKNMGQIALPCSGCMIIGIFINYISFGSSVINLAIKIIIYAVLYFVVMRLFAVNSYEKELLNIIFNKIKIKLHPAR